MKEFLQRILQEIMKKIILGTSDAWSMRRFLFCRLLLLFIVNVFRYNTQNVFIDPLSTDGFKSVSISGLRNNWT